MKNLLDLKSRSKTFNKVLKMADKYATSNLPLLLLGETGVGKEWIAKRIHIQSQRPLQYFLPLNCAALPPQLFESELFGYEKGSFTGANQTTPGLLKSLHGGTLFLDEIGELLPYLQAKLLRVIETGEIRPLGGNKISYVRIRIISATHIDLYEQTGIKDFRHDLLQRLGALVLKIPPLRERPEDLIPLAQELLQEMGFKYELKDLCILETYEWPGNIRQLKNVLARAATLNEGYLDSSLLQEILAEEKRNFLTSSSSSETLRGTLEEIERRVILDRLKYYYGNRKLTAQALGIAKSTLQNKLRELRKVETSWPVVGSPFMGTDG